MKNNALVLTGGFYKDNSAKTAHGLVRGTSRFAIKGIVDGSELQGQDAGVVLDNRNRHIPIYSSLDEAFLKTDEKIDFLIIGVATKGGKLPDEFREIICEAIGRGVSIVNGLHQFLSNDAELVKLASNNNVELIDVRKPKDFEDLKFWSGKIKTVKCPVVAVLGTDCKLGKRTTTKILTDLCKDNDIRAEMIYTGQTGWMQGSNYGFVFDSTPNDFISGELEHAIVSCYKEISPDIIFLEGQSSLRNPSGPCGAEFILSGAAKYVVLQHSPKRIYFGSDEELAYPIPSVESEIELLSSYGARVIAISLNTDDLTVDEFAKIKSDYEFKIRIPVFNPFSIGGSSILFTLKQVISKHEN